MKRIRRRSLLGAAALAAALPTRIFAQTSTLMRPRLLQGVQAGDFSADGAVIWSRSDRPARMFVEHATTDLFDDAYRIEGPLALEATDFTSRMRITGMKPGQTVHYRVTYLDLDSGAAMSAPSAGRFRTPPAGNSDVSFVWSADTVGQGFGINPDSGGMTIYEAMRKLAPDFFVHSGDTIYADNPLQAERKLPDGKIWRNTVTEAKSKVAETLEEFRGNHRYNFLDDNLRAFNSEVPILAQWDDHEVIDNWYWEKELDGDPRYKEKSVRVLATRAERAFREYLPIGQGRRRPPAPLPAAFLRPSARRLSHRHAQLPQSQRRQPRDDCHGFSRHRAASLAETGAQIVAGHLENRCRRHAARPRGVERLPRQDRLGGGRQRR